MKSIYENLIFPLLIGSLLVTGSGETTRTEDFRATRNEGVSIVQNNEQKEGWEIWEELRREMEKITEEALPSQSDYEEQIRRQEERMKYWQLYIEMPPHKIWNPSVTLYNIAKADKDALINLPYSQELISTTEHGGGLRIYCGGKIGYFADGTRVLRRGRDGNTRDPQCPTSQECDYTCKPSQKGLPLEEAYGIGAIKHKTINGNLFLESLAIEPNNIGAEKISCIVPIEIHRTFEPGKKYRLDVSCRAPGGHSGIDAEMIITVIKGPAQEPLPSDSQPSLLACIPSLIKPDEGAVLDNGRRDRLDKIVWNFDWSDCTGASQYHLYVIHSGAQKPVIDNNMIINSSYQDVSPGSYIIESNRYNWTWKVRAKINGQWGDWSEIRTFDVEPLNSDPPYPPE